MGSLDNFFEKAESKLGSRDMTPLDVALSPSGAIIRQGAKNRRDDMDRYEWEREKAMLDDPNFTPEAWEQEYQDRFVTDPEYNMGGSGDEIMGYDEQGNPIYGMMGMAGAGAAYGASRGGGGAYGGIDPSGTQASWQQRGLDYLMEQERLPTKFREGALKTLAGVYGLPGGRGDQQQFIDEAIQSPLYKSIMGGKDAGEEAILRSASATGGLRSGDVQSAMYDYNTQLQNKALLESYNQRLMGLGGMANLPSMAPQISGTMGQIGETHAMGQVAAQQAQKDRKSNLVNTLLGVGKLGVEAYSSGLLSSMFSDRRLKSKIQKIGEIEGQPWYEFTWNSVANKLGLYGKTYGAMADEVFNRKPDAVFLKDGFLMVNYSEIGVF